MAVPVTTPPTTETVPVLDHVPLAGAPVNVSVAGIQITLGPAGVMLGGIGAVPKTFTRKFDADAK